jgi:uncharacterized protein
VWRISQDDLDAIALGAAILGTGGGGNPYMGRLQARVLWQRGLGATVVSPDSIADDATVISVGGMGAPTVGIEKLRRGDEEMRALRAVERHIGRKVDAIVPVEIGGSNSIRPLFVAAQADLPVIDADGMGRAFPELQMTTYFMFGAPAAPAAIADEKGNVVLIDSAVDATAVERMARLVCTYMGGTAGTALSLMTGAQVKASAIPRTLSLVRDLGRTILDARRRHDDPVEAALGVLGGQLLFRGKIVDVRRHTAGGFVRGHFVVDGSDRFVASTLRVELQNENLVATRDGEVVATVPDLICAMSSEEGEAVTTETLRYGLRVSVLGVAAPKLLKRPEALRMVTPAAFGYDLAYDPRLPGTYPTD